MRSPFLWVAGTFALSIWAACNCGKQGATTNCNESTICPTGSACVDGQCVSCAGSQCPPGDGGGDGGAVDGGGNGSDGGSPDGGNDAGCVNLQCQQVGCPDGGTTTIIGSVYDPSGQVPLSGALVYVPNGTVQPFRPGVSCDLCGAFTSGSPLVTAYTAPDGTFTLANVPTGSSGFPLVIQVGRWRRQVTIPAVSTCSVTPITDVNLLRLPRDHTEGDIPQMAIATGHADPMECLLRKIGISDSEFTAPDGGGRIHYYRVCFPDGTNCGVDMSPPAPSGTVLWSDAGTLMNYDVVLLPCEGGEDPKPIGFTQNLVNYTSAGGRLFTTHYGYVWLAPSFSAFPPNADWRPDPNQTHNPPTPFTVNVDQSFFKGVAFSQWLVNVQASGDAGFLDLYETRHDLFGTDAGSQRWLYANNPNFGSALSVQHMTFNTPVNPPALPDGGTAGQCGRVVFSDFHVTTNALTGAPTFPASCRVAPLTPQEKALVFMLFDVSSCIQSDTCPGSGQSCSATNACCTGLVCKNNTGQLCGRTETGCTCQAPLCPIEGQACSASFHCCSGLVCKNASGITCQTGDTNCSCQQPLR